MRLPASIMPISRSLRRWGEDQGLPPAPVVELHPAVALPELPAHLFEDQDVVPADALPVRGVLEGEGEHVAAEHAEPDPEQVHAHGHAGRIRGRSDDNL